MAQEKLEYSQSMIEALPYIRRAVSEGLTATNALSQYRSGGGSIRDSSWYSMFRNEFAYSGTREKIKDVPYTYTVPETMFETDPFDYRQKYVMQLEVTGYSSELDQRITKWVSVESDHLLTKNEWRSYAQQAVFDTIGSPDFNIDGILSWDARMREQG